MKKSTHRGAMLSGAAMVLALSAVSATAAYAQSSQDAPVIEEIIVTAQKRSENVQKVPIAISVVSGEAMERANINSAEQLIQAAPSLTFRKGNTNKDSALTVRGVGTVSFASGVAYPRAVTCNENRRPAAHPPDSGRYFPFLCGAGCVANTRLYAGGRVVL